MRKNADPKNINDAMCIFSSGGTAVEEDVTTGVTTGMPAKVILFNDNVHTFDDVIIQFNQGDRLQFFRGGVEGERSAHARQGDGL